MQIKRKKKYITYENRDLRVQKLQVIKNNNGPEMNNIYSSQRGKIYNSKGTERLKNMHKYR